MYVMEFDKELRNSSESDAWLSLLETSYIVNVMEFELYKELKLFEIFRLKLSKPRSDVTKSKMAAIFCVWYLANEEDISRQTVYLDYTID